LVIATLLVMAGSETLLRAGFARPAFQYPFGLDFAIHLDRKRLFRVVPRSGPDINGQGHRDEEFARARSTRPRVAFLGDSYLMGMTTPSGQTIPNQLEALLGGGAEVFNLGVFGYGPDQSWVQLRDEVLDYNPDVVVLATMPANDFADIDKNHLFETTADGGIRDTTTNAVTAVLPAWEWRYVYDYQRFRLWGHPDYFKPLFRVLHHDKLDLDPYDPTRVGALERKRTLMRALLRTMRDALRARRIRFVVLSIPYGPRAASSIRDLHNRLPFANEHAMRLIAVELALEFLDLVPVLGRPGERDAWYVGDRSGEHLNRTGHARVAQAVAALLRRLP
jgi:lysophospholipase L1-like esterase